jgi:hypothetical protein
MAKTNEELTEIISTLIEGNELQNQATGTLIHGEVGVIIAMIRIELSRLQFQKKISEENYAPFVQHFEDISKLISEISYNLNPSVFLNLGLIKLLDLYNRQKLDIKKVMISLTNQTTTELSFDDKTLLKIYRVYDYCIKYFIVFLKALSLNVVISNSQSSLLFEIVNASEKEVIDENIENRNLVLKTIEAYIFILKGKLESESDFINSIKFSVPLPNSNVEHL